jgi:hypothetical protein
MVELGDEKLREFGKAGRRLAEEKIQRRENSWRIYKSY